MEIYANFEKYSPSRVSKLDQLICLAKGTLDMIMINQTFLEMVQKLLTQYNFNLFNNFSVYIYFSIFKLSSPNATFEKDFLKTIEVTKPKLEAGHCLYIPKNWYKSLASILI